MTHKEKEMKTEKHCLICGRVLPLKNFYISKQKKGDKIYHVYNSYCKKCSYDINRWYRIRLHSREGRVHFMQHEECYLKEAKAMIRGKHWEGKNRCVKLEGDA